MKDRLSALMDGELDDKSAAEVFEALGRHRDAFQTWRTYQLISDAMRQGRLLSDGFTARVSARLAAEPTVLAPRVLQPEPRRWFALSAAASLAAVALVGWMAFAPQQEITPPPAPVAQTQLVETKPVIVPLPTAANDYLLAHQGFSPRISLQGMAPYVRTVSEQTVEQRK
ncbi:MAG: sigma-E factor negative regulatory protein [Burkholderiales bacterium]